MKKSVFQILNICLGLLGFATILFCSYCFGKLNQFNPFLYTILCVGVVLSALSIKVCTNDFSSKCLMQIYLVVLCVTFIVEVSLVITYFDPESQGWLLEQLPAIIQQQLQKYIHIVGIIFLGVAVCLVLMFALGIEILYFKSDQMRARGPQGPDTYLLGDSDINNLIGYETARRYKKVKTREQASQYQLEGGGYLCVKCYRLECECEDNAIQVLPESDTADPQVVQVAEIPTAPSLCLRCHDLECKCKSKQPGLCSACFEDPCSCPPLRD